MSKSVAIEAEVDDRLKEEAEAVLEALGLTASEAISLFYAQIARRKELPFDSRFPNAETRRAIRDLRQGRNLSHYRDTDELFDRLGS